jgi:hypothetical protein
MSVRSSSTQYTAIWIEAYLHSTVLIEIYVRNILLDRLGDRATSPVMVSDQAQPLVVLVIRTIPKDPGIFH